MAHLVDARGLACPLPVVNTKTEISKMAAGETVETIVDNETAVQNLRKFAGVKGFAVTDEKRSDSEYHVFITLGENVDPAAVTEENVEYASCRPENIVVAFILLLTVEEHLKLLRRIVGRAVFKLKAGAGGTGEQKFHIHDNHCPFAFRIASSTICRRVRLMVMKSRSNAVYTTPKRIGPTPIVRPPSPMAERLRLRRV